MTKITGAKITGAKIKHEFTFLSVPGLEGLFDPGRGVVVDGSSNARVWNDSATGKKVLQTVVSSRPFATVGEGGFPIIRFEGGEQMIAETKAPFNFLHQGNKIAVFTVLKPNSGVNNLESLFVGTSTNSTTSVGFHVILDDRDSFSRVNAIHSSIKKGVGPSGYAGVLTNNSTTNLTDLRLVQSCFRGARTGGDFEQYINKTLVGSGEIAGTPSAANSSLNFQFGGNHDNYLTLLYNWNDASDSEYESRRLMVESLIYQKFNVSSTVLPE